MPEWVAGKIRDRVGVDQRGPIWTGPGCLHLRPFPRLRRAAIAHQQKVKENVHVIFHPSISCTLEASSFIPSLPGFEVVGDQEPAADHAVSASSCD